MNILLVTNAFYPEISPRSYRATELAKAFCIQGHEVVVITRERVHNYTDFLKQFPLVIKMWKGVELPTISISKHHPWSWITKGIKRLMMILFEYPAIEDMFNVRKMLRVEKSYDLMISFAVPYPVHWGVAWARSNKRSIAHVWIADCGDPYMGDVLDSFRKPFYFAYLEKWFCRKAEYITIPISSAISAYYPEFHDKIRIIPQGFSFMLPNAQQIPPAREVPEFAYAGSFLQGIRDPGPLLDFLSVTEMPFRFHVYTDQPEVLIDYIEPLKDKLIISRYIQREQLLEELSTMDFLINFDNGTTLNIPSKLIDYSITGRPVLNIDKKFSIERISAFLAGDYSGRMHLPNPMHYHISNVSLQFIGLLNPKS